MNLCRSIISFLLAVTVASPGAVAESRDSVAALTGDPVADGWVAPVAAGGFLTAAGAVGRASVGSSWSFAEASSHKNGLVEVGQYLPLALPWGVKAFGGSTRSGWGRMAVSQGLGVGIMAGSVYLLKHAVDTPRPDASDNRSFPSGHSAWAFMGATMTARELGWRSPWWAFGAYSVATAIAAERVVSGRHYPTDVVAGAGIGILSAQLGYIVGDMIFGGRQIDSRSLCRISENNNLSFLSLDMGLDLPLGRVAIGRGKIVRLPALSAGVYGGFAIGDNWGLGVQAGLISTPIQVEENYERTHVAPLNQVGFTVGPYYRLALSRRVSLSADAAGGYYRNLKLKSLDDAVEAGSGTAVGRVSFGSILKLSDHFSCKATIGYQLSHYSFTIHPSEAYHLSVEDKAAGTTGSLLLQVATRVEF